MSGKIFLWSISQDICEEARKARFKSLDALRAQGLTPDSHWYRKVFEKETDEDLKDESSVRSFLEYLLDANGDEDMQDCPFISAGDVVEIAGEDGSSFWFCNAVDFTDITREWTESLESGKKLFTVGWIVSSIKQEKILAENEDQARKLWEAKGYDGDLYFIKDPEGNRTVF